MLLFLQACISFLNQILNIKHCLNQDNQTQNETAESVEEINYTKSEKELEDAKAKLDAAEKNAAQDERDRQRTAAM